MDEIEYRAECFCGWKGEWRKDSGDAQKDRTEHKETHRSSIIIPGIMIVKRGE